MDGELTYDGASAEDRERLAQLGLLPWAVDLIDELTISDADFPETYIIQLAKSEWIIQADICPSEEPTRYEIDVALRVPSGRRRTIDPIKLDSRDRHRPEVVIPLVLQKVGARLDEDAEQAVGVLRLLRWAMPGGALHSELTEAAGDGRVVVSHTGTGKNLVVTLTVDLGDTSSYWPKHPAGYPGDISDGVLAVEAERASFRRTGDAPPA